MKAVSGQAVSAPGQAATWARVAALATTFTSACWPSTWVLDQCPRRGDDGRGEIIDHDVTLGLVGGMVAAPDVGHENQPVGINEAKRGSESP